MTITYQLMDDNCDASMVTINGIDFGVIGIDDSNGVFDVTPDVQKRIHDTIKFVVNALTEKEITNGKEKKVSISSEG